MTKTPYTKHYYQLMINFLLMHQFTITHKQKAKTIAVRQLFLSMC
ncbi:hypothetical protein H9M94_00905 [Mycoplasma sp. Pen4]|nr:hypothetical protein H9M94_00905 [Mycoplasma sp. Pen4]